MSPQGLPRTGGSPVRRQAGGHGDISQNGCKGENVTEYCGAFSNGRCHKQKPLNSFFSC